MTFPNPGLGGAIAIVVLVLAILGIFGVLPASTVLCYSLIGALAVARLC